MSSEDYVMVNIFDHGGHMTKEEMEMYGEVLKDFEERPQILNHIIDSTDDLLENVFAVGLNIRYGWSSFVCRDARPKMLKQPLEEDEGRTILHTIYDTNKDTHERDGEIYLWTRETGMPNLMISSDQFPSMGIHIPDSAKKDGIATHLPPGILYYFYKEEGGRDAANDAINKIGGHGGNIYIPLYIIIEWLKRDMYPGKKIILLITNCQVVSSDIEPQLQKEIAETYVRGEMAGKMLIDTIDSMSSLKSKIEVWESINEERKKIRETASQSLAAESQDDDGFGAGEDGAAWIDEKTAERMMEEARKSVEAPTDDNRGLKAKINYLIDVFDELDTIQKPPGGGGGGGAAAYGSNGGKRKRRKTKRKSRRQIGCGIKKKHTRRKRTKRTKKKRNKKRVTKQKRYKRK
jgi:hypothetical protein